MAPPPGVNTFLIRSLTKGLHAWMHDNPPPRISEKKHPVHVLVKEAYDDQEIIGWSHAIRGRLSKKWQQAQSLHSQVRVEVNPPQKATLIRIIWKAMDT
eukprot:CAMPEP_0194333340 /NCGR_PEP_ID=MMETSP0171-20130528/62446_1 /TAXON_ID=218684 /ORGANISM="Corethron pennatum, Strain L29A3" /LENGTH=98 /DNA_ID=CAMNT_0039095531 /DNA_START=447 /DNA_END=739 /DNA_ORIENTATION=+